MHGHMIMMIYSATMEKAHTTLLILFHILLTITPNLAQKCNTGATRCWQCSDKNGSTETPSAAYKANLKALLFSFPTLQSQNDVVGYYNTTKGNGPNDQVTVVGLCRGDLANDTKLCQSCLNETATTVLEQCPAQKEAIIWGEKCLVKYSNDSSFHLMEEEPYLELLSPNNYTAYVGSEIFKKELKSLLEKLIANASSSVGKYAMGSVNVTTSESIFSLVQCVPSLSSSECGDCLNESSSKNLDECCGGADGARILKPGCTLRYERGMFYNPTALVSPPTTNNTTSEPSTKGTDGEKNGEDKIGVPTLWSLIGVVTLGLLVHGFP